MSKSKQIRGRRAAARIADALTGSIGRTSGATPQSEVTLGALSPAEQARFRLAIQERGFEDPKALLAATYEGRAADPVKWIRERLGEHPWSKQREILESIRDHRYTAVPSCHDVGKSFIAARAAAYWIENHPPGEAFVVTTAPTWRQVKNILWRELGRAHARGKLIGRMNQTEWALTMPAGNEETVAFGNKPADMDPSAFQGIHARYVLVIFDEACGIPETLWNAAEGLVTNEDCRFLAIGNPDDPATEFANVCKPGSGWNVIHISAFDSPNFTGEWVPPEVRHVLVSQTWVEEKKRKWGEDNPVYISKVLGRFPDTSVDGLIPMGLIRAAQQRELAPSEPVELGIDVGGGGDKNVIAHRRGPVVRIIRRDQTNDTMQTLGNAMHAIRLTNATCAKIDAIGIGKGAADRAKEMGRLTKSADRATREIAKRIVGISVGEAARDNEGYLNLRAEGYWGLRERFMAGDIDLDPNDDDLAAQLVEIRYTRTSSGKVQIESKSEMKKRNLHSPDDADAVMLSFLHAKADSVRPTWGKRDRNREGDAGRRASAARGDGRGVYRHR